MCPPNGRPCRSHPTYCASPTQGPRPYRGAKGQQKSVSFSRSPLHRQAAPVTDRAGSVMCSATIVCCKNVPSHWKEGQGLIVAAAGFVAAVIILALVALGKFGAGTPNDALLMKNLTFFFGHMLVNITMYLGVAVVYELLSMYAHRSWKTNKIVAIP